MGNHVGIRGAFTMPNDACKCPERGSVRAHTHTYGTLDARGSTVNSSNPAMLDGNFSIKDTPNASAYARITTTCTPVHVDETGRPHHGVSY